MLEPGETPLLVSMPHTATAVPAELAGRVTEKGRTLPDTDWHVDRLSEFAAGFGTGTIRPTYSRYVIDLNRPPDGEPLYVGASNTELCPTSTFADEAIWLPGREPKKEEIEARREAYWRPYHDALRAELHRLKERHGL